MTTKKTLFYKNKDYTRAILALERITPYILCKFAVIGGIANRFLFPDWGQTQQDKKFNDLDIVLLPTKKESNKLLIDANIKNDFFVNYICPNSGLN